MALANEAENAFQRFQGGNSAPTGSYVNLRTMSYVQSASDQTLPLVGIWLRVTTSGTSTASQIATALNTALGTSYTSGSLHAEGSPDLAYEPGQSVSDQ